MGNVDEWIIPMAGEITEYYRFPGNTSSCYEIYFVENAQGNYVPAQRRFGGIPATNTLSGEIIVKLEILSLFERESANGREPVKQIVFAGERFDVMSVRRWRERVLGLGA